MENKAKGQIPTKPSHLRITPTQAHSRRSKKTPDKVGLKVAQQGCGHTHGAATHMLAYHEPNLARSVHTTSPRMVHRVKPRFNVPRGWFGTFLEG